MEVQQPNRRGSRKYAWRYIQRVALILLWCALVAGISWKIWSDVIRPSPNIERLAQDTIKETKQLCEGLPADRAADCNTRIQKIVVAFAKQSSNEDRRVDLGKRLWL